MDLHFTADEPTADERSAVDRCLGPPGSGWEGGERRVEVEGRTFSSGHESRGRRHLLLPVLHALQAGIGWISAGALNYVCKRLNVPPADAFGVADFYALLSTSRRPPAVVHVCDDIACLARGADKICHKLETEIGPAGTPSADGRATWLRSPCLGQCERAPVALASSAGEHPRERVLPATDASSVLNALKETNGRGHVPADTFDPGTSVPQAGQPQLRLLRGIGRIDPERLESYQGEGGYRALEKAFEKGPKWVIEELEKSKLVGRGGAAFPAFIKWKAVAEASKPSYVICNADESEPGTFKDRILMEGDPFAVIEAMTIAGYATGSEKSFLYIRGEYPFATERLERAIAQAREANLLGENVMGRGVRFDIEIRRGGGAYICGEETALFNSIEGFRGEPRNKPPFPTQAGLFGRPTLVNNVETLVSVPWILLEGGEAYAKIGTERSTGTKLFCLSGHVARPGIYEVEFGATLRDVIEMAGGFGGTGKIQAILLGGAAGAFVSPDELDAPLTFEGTREIGATLGSAVVMPFDDTVDMKKILLRIAQFFRDESCGQCVPCRVGTQRQEELLRRLDGGQPLGTVDNELVLLKDIGQVMRDASICGLGHTASSAVESALKRWKIFA